MRSHRKVCRRNTEQCIANTACGLCFEVPALYADVREDELSEEDQQLKDELEMLVERLKVRRFLQPVLAQRRRERLHLLVIGTRYLPLRTRLGRNQKLHQDLYLFHDGCSEASQIPPPALR